MATAAIYPSLPFALGGFTPAEGDGARGGVAQRVGELHRLMLETREQLEALRRDSSAILHILSAPAPAQRVEPGGERAPVRRGVRPAARKREDEGLIRFHLMGSFEVQANGAVISSSTSRKARLLLAYLAMDPRRAVPRDALIELFWPESAPSRGSNNLSIAVYQLRTLLKDLVRSEHGGIVVQQGLYSLERNGRCWVDVDVMQRHLAEARTALLRKDRATARREMAAAAALYRGDFMASEPYEEWTLEPRRSLAAAHGRALAWLAEDAAVRGDWDGVIDHAKRTLERDGSDEEGHRWLMTAYWKLGNRAQALQQYRVCEERLESDLGVAPSEATRKLYRAIRG